MGRAAHVGLQEVLLAHALLTPQGAVQEKASGVREASSSKEGRRGRPQDGGLQGPAAPSSGWGPRARGKKGGGRRGKLGGLWEAGAAGRGAPQGLAGWPPGSPRPQEAGC